MERFLPGRHSIDSFGNGGFRLAGVSHQGSLLVTPLGVRALELDSVAALTPGHLEQILAEKADFDILLIGTGRDIAALPKQVQELLQAEAVGFDVMSTNAAVRTYNVVIDEERRVAAIMIAVDKAYG
jgi:uncharacterized protein